MLNLPNVTLVSVTSVNINKHIKSLRRSSKRINFGSIILLTDSLNVAKIRGINVIPIAKINSIDDYSYFIIYKLHEFIHTSHCLIVQGDSYVLSPKSWQSIFLTYDYIGAPWPEKINSYITPFGENVRVGNGGFSLRSKKLLEVPTKVKVPFYVNKDPFYKNMGTDLLSEDGNICVHNKHIFEGAGCVFAPLDVALSFSYENNVLEYDGRPTFGFHKNKPNMYVKVLSITLHKFRRIRFGQILSRFFSFF